MSVTGAATRASLQIAGSNPGLTLSPNRMVRLELRDLERAIAQRPEEQRSVILLVGLKGMRYDEAAAVVDLPVGTVRSRVSRGRETLRTVTGLFPGPIPGVQALSVKGRNHRRSANENLILVPCAAGLAGAASAVFASKMTTAMQH